MAVIYFFNVKTLHHKEQFLWHVLCIYIQLMDMYFEISLYKRIDAMRCANENFGTLGAIESYLQGFNCKDEMNLSQIVYDASGSALGRVEGSYLSLFDLSPRYVSIRLFNSIRKGIILVPVCSISEESDFELLLTPNFESIFLADSFIVKGAILTIGEDEIIAESDCRETSLAACGYEGINWCPSQPA